MEKETYQPMEMEVISFDVGEVIVASFPDAPVLPPAPFDQQ